MVAFGLYIHIHYTYIVHTRWYHIRHVFIEKPNINMVYSIVGIQGFRRYNPVGNRIVEKSNTSRVREEKNEFSDVDGMKAREIERHREREQRSRKNKMRATHSHIHSLAHRFSPKNIAKMCRAPTLNVFHFRREFVDYLCHLLHTALSIPKYILCMCDV